MTTFFKVLNFFAFFTIALSNYLDSCLDSYKDSHVIKKFENWVNLHKIQAKDDHHLAHMFKNWLSNDKFIEETNSRNLTYTLGHNVYSGMNSDEFIEFMGLRINKDLLSTKKNKYLKGNIYIVQDEIIDLSDLPSSIDWRTKGVVNSVQSQDQCGSCWAFSATASLESASAIKYGKLTKLSEQQLVSCAGLKYGNLGCNGGMYDGAWNYVRDFGGQCSESSYPYTSNKGDTGSCLKDCLVVSGTKVSTYVSVKSKSDTAMMTALTVGPVSIAIEADTRSYQMYKNGIYNDFEGCNSNYKTKGATSQPNIDHAVVLIGYSSENGQDYYILRNSWGISWGENGIMRIARGSQYAPWGMCGVLYDPMYPVV